MRYSSLVSDNSNLRHLSSEATLCLLVTFQQAYGRKCDNFFHQASKAKDHKVMYCGCHKYISSQNPQTRYMYICKYKLLEILVASSLLLKHVMVKNPLKKEQSVTLSPRVPNMSHHWSSHKMDEKTSLFPQWNLRISSSYSTCIYPSHVMWSWSIFQTVDHSALCS